MWSNLAFTRLFIDAAKSELNSDKITRHKRCVVWLAKMLYDFANTSKINHTATIDEISLNTKNDKAFALSGSKTHQYMKSPELTKPRIKQEEINNIILGGGEKLLSPERRFDAIILNTPNLFDWNRFKIYRVSEKKKAFFLIGVHQGKDNELIPYLEKNLSKKSMTVRDYMGNKLGIEYYYRHPRSYKRRGIFSIDEPSPTIRGVNRPIPKTYQKHPGDVVPLSSNVRPLTTQERSYIQTFPDNFIWEGSKTNLEQMIGNAVPVKLAEYVANAILDYVSTSNIIKVQQLSLPIF